MDRIVNELVNDMQTKQDKLYKMVEAAEEQKLKAALNVNEVVEGSIKKLAETNAELTEKLSVLVQNLADIRIDMAKLAGRDINSLPPVGVEPSESYKPQDFAEPIVNQIATLNSSILRMNSLNEKWNREMLNALTRIQTVNEENAKTGVIGRLFGRGN